MLKNENHNTVLNKAKTGDTLSREALIDSNKGFIRRISSYICNRTLYWDNDDELSIALMAFNESIDSFDINKGADFFTYCRIVIKRRLIDYFRRNNMSYISLDSIDDEELSYIENKESIKSYSLTYTSSELAMEIDMFNKELSIYNISIGELTLNSPKHKDTRIYLMKLAIKCVDEEEIFTYIKKNKMLPIKKISELTGAKRKLIERWRKYILTLLLIISSDEYLYLKEYLKLYD